MSLPKFQCTKCEQPFSGGPPWLCLQCGESFDHYFLLKVTANVMDDDGRPMEVLTIEKINDRYEWRNEGKVLVKKYDKIKAAILAISVLAMQNRMKESEAAMMVFRAVFKEEYGDELMEDWEPKRAGDPDSGVESEEGIQDPGRDKHS